jgi:hypothetical protein
VDLFFSLPETAGFFLGDPALRLATALDGLEKSARIYSRR